MGSRLGPWQPATAEERIDRIESLAEIHQRMCTPEMLLAITRRWISEVPSKIV